jgi:AcrR family transcriptional regulator
VATVPWRRQQVDETRRRIVDTYLDLARQDGAGRVSTADVARSSGISPATIYRHFPDRDALVSAAAMADTTSGVGTDVDAWTIEHMVQHLQHLWSRLAENLVVVRAGVATESGRELRLVRFRALARSYAAALRRADIDPAGEIGRRTVATLSLLGSVHAFLDLHDRQGLTPAEAAEAAGWAMRAALHAAGVDPDHFVVREEPDDRASSDAEHGTDHGAKEEDPQ